MTNEECGVLKPGDALYYVCVDPRYGGRYFDKRNPPAVHETRVVKVTASFIFIDPRVGYAGRIDRKCADRFFTSRDVAVGYEMGKAEEIVQADIEAVAQAQKYRDAVAALRKP